MTAIQKSGWVPGTEYARAAVRSDQRAAVERALLSHGIGIDQEWQLHHREQRPPAAPDLDRMLFCYWLAPYRPLGAPDITEVSVRALTAAGLTGMTNGQAV